MKTNEKINGKAVSAEEKIFTTAEKAQYEVFKNGSLSRDTIGEWINNDLRAIASFIHTCLKDKRVNDALIDRHYEIYTELHKKPDEVGRPIIAPLTETDNG